MKFFINNKVVRNMIPSLDIGCEISNENDTSEFFRIFEMKIRRTAIKFDKQTKLELSKFSKGPRR